MELVCNKVQSKQIPIGDSSRFPYTTINLKQLSNILLPYHPSDNMAYTEQLWTIYDLDSSSVVLEENRLVQEPVINMGDIQMPHHYPLQEVNQDLVIIQQTSVQYPGLLLKNNQQQQILLDRQQNLGGGRSSYAPYYVGVSDWPATGISLPRLHSSDKGTIFQMPQSPFSGDHRQSSPSANKLLTPKTYENVPPSAIQKTNILRKQITNSKKSSRDIKIKIESGQQVIPAVPLTSVRQPSERILKIKQQQQTSHHAPLLVTKTSVKIPNTRSRTSAVKENVSGDNDNDLLPRPSTADAPPVVSVQPEEDNVQTPQEPPTDKLTLIRDGVDLLLHVIPCLKENKSEKDDQCNVAGCQEMKNVLTHMKSCRSNQSCRVMECCILRWLTIHRKNCIDFECAICAAFLQRDLQQLRIKCVATAIAILSARRARKAAEDGTENKRPLENTEESLFKKPRVENDSEVDHSTLFSMKLRSSSSRKPSARARDATFTI